MRNSNYVDKSLRAKEYDRALEIVADRHRRLLLHHLVDEKIAHVDKLADAVSEHVDEDRSRIATALVHAQLPKLDGAGIVDYDRRSGTVRYYGHCFLEDVLERTADADRSGE